MRDQLKNVERMTGVTPKELQDLVALPEAFVQSWVWFLDLNNSRQSGMGANPISYTEIQSYFSLFGIEPEAHEIRAIKMFDNEALRIESKRLEKEASKNKNNK